MDLAGIIRRVQTLGGDESGKFLQDEDIIDWANDAQIEICRMTGIIRVTTSINAVGGTTEYALPARFIRERRVRYSGVRLFPITIETLDQLDRDKDNTANRGIPTYYYIVGSTIGLFSTPSDSVTNGISVTYDATPSADMSELTDVPEIPAYMHPELVRLAFAKAKEKDEDYEAAAFIQADVVARLAELRDLAQNQAGTSYPAVRDIDSPDLHGMYE